MKAFFKLSEIFKTFHSSIHHDMNKSELQCYHVYQKHGPEVEKLIIFALELLRIFFEVKNSFFFVTQWNTKNDILTDLQNSRSYSKCSYYKIK